MKYLYIILILILLFLLVLNNSNNVLEKFIQIENKTKICNDNKANNYINSNINVDNSYCIYDFETICNRPFALNYDDSIFNIDYDGVCAKNEFSNFNDPYYYEKNDNGNYILDDGKNKIKIKLTKNDIDENFIYFDKKVKIDDDGIHLNYTDDNSVVYKQKYKIDNTKCKLIDNKKCRYPMNNILNDSLLYNGINESSYNIYDENGYISLEMLKYNDEHLYNKNIKFNEQEFNLMFSIIDNYKNIIKRKGYNINDFTNYKELVDKLNNKGYNIAIAVDNNNKYSFGLSKSKSISCDIALVRCYCYLSNNELEKHFKNKKIKLIELLLERLKLYPEKSLFGNIINCKIINDSNEDEKKYYNIIEQYLYSLDYLNLALLYYKSLTHKELYYLYNYEITQNEIESVENNNSSIDLIFIYLFNKNKIDNTSGIYMINNNRYINFNNDAKNIIDICNISDINNLCHEDNCNEVTVLGNKNNKCILLQDFNILDNNDNNHEDNKIELTKKVLDKCNKIANNCIVYKINNKIYSYNSLY